MELIRRMSTRPGIDEEHIQRLSQQRRKSSFAATAHHDEPILPSAIQPLIQIFPGSTSTRQETLLFSPDSTAKGYVITCAHTGKHILTAASPSSSMPGPSHTKYFYGTLNIPIDRKRNGSTDSNASTQYPPLSTKLCTLTRDAVSFRKRHHVDDPYNSRRLIELEFSLSTWEANALKANIELLNKYSDSQPMEPVRLKWRGKKASLEGVLEWNHKPAAVCAKGQETEEGEYVVYVAPGMDLYVCAIVIMAVDDRIERGSDNTGRKPSFNRGRKNDHEAAQ